MTRDRHDSLIRHLRRTGSATVGDLAQELRAPRRTILRDIGALREQGFVLHTDPGRGGGVQLDPSSIQTTPKLTVPEVFALLISLAAMRAVGGLPFAGLADAGLAKIERALPPDRLRDLRQFLGCLHIGPLSPQQDLSDMGAIDPELLPAFEAAFLRQLPLRFTYRDGQGRHTARQVEPQAMLILPPLWYLVAWDPARDGFRHFRMDRISAPELCDGPTFRRRRVPFEQDVCPYSQLMASTR